MQSPLALLVALTLGAGIQPLLSQRQSGTPQDTAGRCDRRTVLGRYLPGVESGMPRYTVAACVRLLQEPVFDRREPQPPAATPETAIEVRLQTLAFFMRTLGARLVHVPELEIDKIVSPQAFTVRTRYPDGGRAMVLLAGASDRQLLSGTPVEVRGRAYTLAGASVRVGWPEDLTSAALEAFRDVPVIAAQEVRTPEGVELYRAASR